MLMKWSLGVAGVGQKGTMSGDEFVAVWNTMNECGVTG